MVLLVLLFVGCDVFPHLFVNGASSLKLGLVRLTLGALVDGAHLIRHRCGCGLGFKFRVEFVKLGLTLLFLLLSEQVSLRL